MHGIFVLIPLFLFASWVSTGLRERSQPIASAAQAAGRRSPSFESRVFRIAARNGGRVTVSDIVIETGMGIDEVEAAMERLTDNLRVRAEVTERGMFEYEFPELAQRRQAD